MAKGRINSEYGPSWRDVGECLNVLQTKWGGAWSVRLMASVRRGEPGRMSVVCSRLSVPNRSNPGGEDYVSRVYPNGDSATLAICMYDLLLGLDGKLDKRNEDAKRQMTF